MKLIQILTINKGNVGKSPHTYLKLPPNYQCPPKTLDCINVPPKLKKIVIVLLLSCKKTKLPLINSIKEKNKYLKIHNASMGLWVTI